MKVKNLKRFKKCEITVNIQTFNLKILTLFDLRILRLE